MKLKYIGTDGGEHLVCSAAQLSDLISRGVLNAASLMYDEPNERWVRASAHPEFNAALSGQTLPKVESKGRNTHAARWAPWVLYAAGVAVLVVVSAATGLGLDKAAYLFGESLPVGLLAFVIASVASRKDAARSHWGGIAYLVFCSYLLLQAVQEASQQRQDAASIEKRMDQFVDIQTKITTGAVVPKVSNEPLPQVSEAKTDLQKVALLLDRAAQRSTNISAEYQETLRNARYDEILSPDTLSSDRGRSSAHSRLAIINSAIDTWDQQTGQAMTDYQREIQSSGLSASSMREALEGYNKGLASSNQFRRDFAAVEHALMQSAEEIVTLADMSSPHLSKDRKTLVFANANYANRYNELIRELNAQVARETQILSDRTDRLRKARDDMKNIASGS